MAKTQDEIDYEKYKNRKPDVQSVRANLKDYYVYDDETKTWIWKEDYPKIMKKRYSSRIAKYMRPKKDIMAEYDRLLSNRVKEKKKNDEVKATVTFGPAIIRHIAQ